MADHRGEGRAAVVVRAALAVVFALALVGKLLNPPAMVESIQAVGWVPAWLAGPAAVLVLLLEAAAVPLLLSRRGRPLGALLSLVLGGLFLGVTSFKILRGVGGDCACFGLLFRTPPPVTLLIDFGLVLGALYLLRPVAQAIRLRLPAAPPDAPAFPRTAVWSLGASFLVVALAAGAMVAGPWVPRQRVEPVMTLRCGRSAPDDSQDRRRPGSVVRLATPVSK